MSRKAQKYYRVDTGKFQGVYELDTIDKPKQDKRERLLCPCCNKPLKPLNDVIQWGFWQDSYLTFFLCNPCQKAWVYTYVVVCDVTHVETGV